MFFESAIYYCWKLENNFVCSGSHEAGRLWPRPQEYQVHDIILAVYGKCETRSDLLGVPYTKQNRQLSPRSLGHTFATPIFSNATVWSRVGKYRAVPL